MQSLLERQAILSSELERKMDEVLAEHASSKASLLEQVAQLEAQVVRNKQVSVSRLAFRPGLGFRFSREALASAEGGTRRAKAKC